MIISDFAHKQNQEARKDLASKGYQISIGHDGWSILLHSDEIAKGFPERGLIGEARHRQCLDAAVHQAKKLWNDAHPPVAPAQVPIEEKATVKGGGIQARAVAAALGFLRQSGAIYHIEFEGQIFSNKAVKAMKSVKPNFSGHYLPLIQPNEEKMEYVMDIAVPPEFDFNGYVMAFRNYIHTKYGKGRYVTETEREKRTISLMVSASTL